MADENEAAAARVHWLVAGVFGGPRDGAPFRVSPNRLDEALAARVGSIRARVPDRLGAGAERELTLPLKNLRAFTLGGVLEAVAELKALAALAQQPPADKQALVAAVEQAVGPGKLSAACAAAYDATPAPASPASGPAAALNAVVSSMSNRPGGPGAATARKTKEILEAAVYGTALDLLRSPPAAQAEAAWRGLRMLLEQTGKDIDVQVIDVEPGGVAEALRSLPPGEEFEEPDAVFALDPMESGEALAELAEAAEEMLAPCVVTPGLKVLEASNLSEMAAREEGANVPEPWRALRAAEATRWLGAALNRVALFSEGAGAYKRTAFGSPVWAMAAMLSASYRTQGSFAALVGPTGAFQAPAGWTLTEGPFRGSRAPTEAFLPIRAQQLLAALGVIALGSTRDTDRVVLSAAPVVCGIPGAVPLPAQLLTGRIVRFARWARRQVDPNMPPADLKTVFEQAAAVFLFPHMAEASAFSAQVKGEGGDRILHVAAKVKATHALVPLAIEFDLPI
jgi:type VI secretion system protein ImpC